MASQLTKRGYKYRSLPTNDTDTFGDFLNDDSEFNIKKLDTDLEKLDDKVLLEGKRQQNFNFIGSPLPVEKVAYGLRVDLKADTFTRLGGAVGKTNVNDFINIPPFNGKLEIVEGQHMKKIPLFYYKRVPIELEDIPKSSDNNEIGKQLVVWEDWISCYPFEDMYVHPMFIRGGKVVPYVYFSQYEGSIYDTSAGTYLLNDEQVTDFNNDLLCSIPNVKPASGITQNLTIEMARKLAENRNTNSKYTWFQQDFTTVSGIQLLITIACGGYDCQASVGRGVVDLTDNGSTNTALKTGATQSMGLYCGNSGVDGKSSVNFFGIENFWGNIWKFVDGFNIKAKTIHQGWIGNDDYTCNTSSNKDNLGFTISKANGYMSRMGYSSDIDFGFVPTETKSGEPISKDYLWQNSTYNGFLVARLGGRWNSASYAGCFVWSLGHASGHRSRAIGARLVCIPK